MIRSHGSVTSIIVAQDLNTVDSHPLTLVVMNQKNFLYCGKSPRIHPSQYIPLPPPPSRMLTKLISEPRQSVADSKQFWKFQESSKIEFPWVIYVTEACEGGENYATKFADNIQIFQTKEQNVSDVFSVDTLTSHKLCKYYIGQVELCKKYEKRKVDCPWD